MMMSLLLDLTRVVPSTGQFLIGSLSVRIFIWQAEQVGRSSKSRFVLFSLQWTMVHDKKNNLSSRPNAVSGETYPEMAHDYIPRLCLG